MKKILLVLLFINNSSTSYIGYAEQFINSITEKQRYIFLFFAPSALVTIIAMDRLRGFQNSQQELLRKKKELEEDIRIFKNQNLFSWYERDQRIAVKQIELKEIGVKEKKLGQEYEENKKLVGWGILGMCCATAYAASDYFAVRTGKNIHE